ncbi:hypothetical protein [Sorangium sp. So ce388]
MQPHDTSFCGGQNFDVLLHNLTPAEAAACRTEILNFTTAQNVTCD